jgi:hypothetical protein
MHPTVQSNCGRQLPASVTSTDLVEHRGVSDRSEQNSSQAEVTRPGSAAARDELGRQIVFVRGGQEEVIPLSAGQAVGVSIVDHRVRVKHVTAVPDATGKCGNPLVAVLSDLVHPVMITVRAYSSTLLQKYWSAPSVNRRSGSCRCRGSC